MLTGEEIRGLMFGKKRSGFSLYSGKEWWRETTKEGKLTHKSGDRFYRGKEWIEGDMLCTQYQKRFKGMTIYGTIFRNPEGTAENQDEYLLLTDAFLSPFSMVD